MPYHDYLTMLAHLLVATIAGAMIGYERSYQGRAAGFRTHTLVCIASALLMLVAMYQDKWFDASAEIVRIDPTRMAQGIMTGIGFLGAGVIMKDGFSVRGLTTAASIWITAAIGILAGIGFYFPVIVATVLTVSALSFFRWLEGVLPSFYYANHVVRFQSGDVLAEEPLRQLIAEHGFSIANMSYGMQDGGRTFEYRMVIRSRDRNNVSQLVDSWRSMKHGVIEFRIDPA